MLKSILLYACLLLVLLSCKKEDTNIGVASLNLIHATANMDNIAVSFSSTPVPYYKNPANISFATSYEYGLPPGMQALSVLSADDTAKVAWAGILNMQPGKIYSFYFAGQKGHIDTLFQQDQIPVYTDSTVGVRFINLSPDSKPVSINRSGSANKEVTNLGYKQISTFKNYSGTANVGGAYEFEIRDQQTDNVLATFVWYYTLQKCNTIVIGGLSESGVSVFQVNNF